ncbi:MAG: aminodeoxychorismate synthase component I [Cyclobacteriaceae bacterium]
MLSGFIDQLNEWGNSKTPFLFIIDFEKEKPLAWRLDQVNSEELLFDINGFTNRGFIEPIEPEVVLCSNPLSFEAYKGKFDKVFDNLTYGNSFLTNLTVKSAIELNVSLKTLFYLSRSRYKCWFKNQFLFFSPESFIQIKDESIFSFPMKGTIDASLPDARRLILENKKELAEHVTIVDLIRNDLSQVAKEVKINRFRYLNEITTLNKTLLQVSTEIEGKLPTGYVKRIGDILFSLLPAGSISGAPKEKTLQIIREAEGESRGYYTGIFGYFDGENLDSGVAIRFIEQQGDQLFYRSGGGITAQSIAWDEYLEVIQKIYVPVA